MENGDLKRYYKVNNQDAKDFARLNANGKIDKDLLPDDVGTTVVANPQGSATQDLTKLQVGETIYGIDTGTEVIANPTLAGTETDLTGLQVGNTKYAVPQPTDVVANPTLAGTEPDLTGLQVGTTKYKVESGMANPMTTQYDMIVAGANGTPTRIGGGTSDSTYKALLRVSGNPYFSTLSPGKITTEQSSAQYKVPFANGNTATSTFNLGKPGSDFGLGFSTTAPTADNTDGIKIVVLPSEPATRHNGWWYIITSSTT